jgi:hypothetical protein
MFHAARSVARRTAFQPALLRRGYAEAADQTKIKLSFVLPHEVDRDTFEVF